MKNLTIKTYFHYVMQSKWRYYFIIFAVIVMASVEALFPFISGKIVDSMNISDFDFGFTLIMFLIGLFVFRGIIEEVQFFINGIIDMRYLERAPRVDYVKKVQNLDYAFHSSKSTGSLISISSRVNGALYSLFNNINIWGLSNLIDIIISIYLIFTLSPIASLIYISTIIIAWLGGYPFLRMNMKMRKKVNDLNDEIGGVIADNMLGFETVKSFAQEQYEIDRLEKKYDKWEELNKKYIISFRFFDGSVYIITLIGCTILLLLSYRNIRDGVWTSGVFVALLGYATGMIWKVFDILYKVRDYMKSSVDLQKFTDVMNTKPSIVESKKAKVLSTISKGIAFKDVSFSYNTKDDSEEEVNHVLKDVNLDINLDETIAFVGRSGSGKTTLTKLLMRYYDVDKGSIRIDDIDIKELKLNSLRRSIGLVPQDPVMFNESIKYNISYGNPDASMEEIIDAAQEAALHDFISSLPDGYDTVVGERGIKLSGGQRQRLAIARVMLLNPEIVVFDEATSQLDSENEKAIQKAFKNLTKNKTTLIIAHRLSTVMHADRIVVFDNGKIVEIGTHDQLMSNNGIYSKLWKLQTESVG